MESENTQNDPNLVSTVGKMFQSILAIYGDVCTLAYLEARLAGKSLFLMLTLLIFCLFFFFTAWVFLMVLVYLGLHPLLGGIAACGVIIFSNLGLIALFLWAVKSLMRNLEFRRTRAQFSDINEPH